MVDIFLVLLPKENFEDLCQQTEWRLSGMKEFNHNLLKIHPTSKGTKSTSCHMIKVTWLVTSP